jgi:hypothetical protein
MSKPFVQDVIPPDRRSIRKIPLPEGKRVAFRVSGKDEDMNSFRKKIGDNTPRKILWGIAVFVLVAVVILSFSLFSRARVSVTPKSSTFSADYEFVGYKDDTGNRGVSYQVMTLRKTLSKEVAALGEEKVERKASGQIIIYNNYSSAKQKLIKNTRFETPNGFVYRISDSVVVPGKTSLGPGSIETTVYADQAGELYNVDLADFTIPGFKGDPRYKFFYAKSKTKMTGGFAGTVKQVEPALRNDTISALHDELTLALNAEAKQSKPDGYVMFPAGSHIDFESLPQTEAEEDDKATINEAGLLQTVIFDRKGLEEELARLAINDYDGSPITVPELESLSFNFASGKGLTPWQSSTVTFNLSGPASVVWTIDKEAIAKALAGKSLSEANAVFATFPSIARAEVAVWPWWESMVPTEMSKINISVKD